MTSPKEKLEMMLTETKEELGLEDYYLKAYEIERDVNYFNETTYSLSMEWIPNELKDEDQEDYNPTGSAIVEKDLFTGRLNHIIFVHEVNLSTKPLIQNPSKSGVIEWIEAETGLSYEQEFMLTSESDGDYKFIACHNKVPLYPAGYIEVKLGEDGELVNFIKIGQFREGKPVLDEAYTLTKDMIEEKMKEQIKLVQIPDEENMILEKLYGVEEIFVSNDGKKTIPFDLSGHENPILYCDDLISWEGEAEETDIIQEDFPDIDEHFNLDLVTIEQAFAREASPSEEIFKNLDKDEAIKSVQNFLHAENPEDSGVWILSELYADSGFVHAILRQAEETLGLEKMVLILDSETYEVVNYFDNQDFIAVYASFDEAENVKVTKDEAYELLKDFISLQACYVYDRELDQYVLCGRIDSNHGVHGTHGQVVIFNE